MNDGIARGWNSFLTPADKPSPESDEREPMRSSRRTAIAALVSAATC
jgi:hypothetical protein